MFVYVNTDKEDHKKFSVNGVIGEASYAVVRDDENWAFVYEDFISEYFGSMSFSCLTEEFKIFHFQADSPHCDWIDVDIYSKQSHTNEDVIQLSIRVETEHWKEPYSIWEFAKKLEELVTTSGWDDVRYFQEDDDFITNGFGICYLVKDNAIIVQDIVSRNLERVNQVIKDAKASLLETNPSLSIPFTFQEEVRIPCEQYLLYFSQFLSDLGIQATNDISHAGEVTLFSVKPESKEHALEVISDALASYLSMPEVIHNQAFELPTKDIALMQLEANVMHLKSQLILSQYIL